VCDGKGRPLVMLLSEGQMSDYKGVALMVDALPRAKALLGDRGYDADWFSAALAERRTTVCIPSKTNRKVPIPHDAALYRQRYKIKVSAASRTGVASILATNAAHTPSCPQSASPQPSSSGSINES
jgi:transposase